ncbi:MAG: gliding motility-associated C-terminal domain-containing protein [Bacteroidales bacterium]|nr:gliding motility-associated C-terminal domain-containing protein [Bacteroidales bacterium]
MKQTTKYLILLTLIIYGFTNSVLSQEENNLLHEMFYFSHDQNMWGPDSSYSIDIDHSLFDVEIDESWGFSEISELFGQQFGVGANIGIYALLRSAFKAHGFNTGSFSLDYPIAVTMDFPEDFMFNYGEPTTIHSSYEVTEGWDLTTSFPPVGVVTLDFEYEFNPFMDIIICVFSCDTIHLIPTSVNVPHTLDTILHLDGGEPPYAVYPCYDENDELGFCHSYTDTILVDLTVPLGFNFEIFVTLPNVITEDYIQEGTNCLIAQGEDPYMDVNLDVIGFLSVMAGFIPDPEGQQIQDAIDILNGTISYPLNTPLGDIIFQIEYSLLSVDFIIANTLHQDIYFCPTIWATLDFPVEMPFSITDPTNGDIEVDSGFSDTITFAVGNDLIIHYPCHDWDSMYVGCRYNIQPTIRNHTWDSIAFSFVIEALSAEISIVLPFKSSIAPAIMPEFTLPGEEPIPQKSPVIAYSGYYDDSEAKDIGPIGIGPLFDWTVSLGYVPLTWFDETWELMHFEEDMIFDGTYIKPRAKSEINSLLYTNTGDYCYGEAYGYVCAQALNGLPPYDFEWSTGQTNFGLITNTDSIYAIPGYYVVTVTDANNCETYASIDVNVNPPLFHSITAADIECYGFFTGAIQTEITGGTEPYIFNWSNGSIHQNPNNLASGWYFVTITDFKECAVYDSVFIGQPISPLTIFAEPTNISCYGTDYGAIDITLSGATSPYSIEWSSGQTYQDLNNLPSGIYTISVTDANDCQWTQNIEIVEPDTLVANINSSNIPCFGANNGSLNVQTTGGTPPYTYHWFHDLNYEEHIITNMHPGYYFVSVTDANGCADTASASISQPNELILDFNIKNVSCKGGHDAYIIVTASGGVPNYGLVWSNGYYTDSIGNLPIGTYTITVTDSNGCKSIEPVNITQPEQRLNSDFTQINNVSCFGFSDASSNVTPNGGTSPYRVFWEDSVVQEDFSGLGMPANIYYNITVTDNNNCIYFDSIKFTQPPLLTLAGSTNPVNCGVSAGSGNVNAQGGTPPYTYLWSNNETTITANTLSAGEVFVIVTDSHLCFDTLYLNVDKTGKIYGTYEVIQENLCFKDSMATAIVYLPDGVEPKTYLWSNGQIGDTAVNLHAGRFPVYASDKYNCTDTIKVLITQPDSINPNSIITEPSCSNIYDGAIEVAPSGGTPNYEYLWDNGKNTAKISEIREGDYMLTITDVNNCSFIYLINLPEAEYCITVYNTITPNNDGVNDTWIVENIDFFPFNAVWIFNRVGNEVFHVENYQNNWNGTFKGKDLPEATYYYIIDLGTGKDPIKGHLTIIR